MKLLILLVAVFAIASAAKIQNKAVVNPAVKPAVSKPVVQEVPKPAEEEIDDEEADSEFFFRRPCVTSCEGRDDGDYGYCASCGGYVSCSGGILYERACPGGLEWDDDVRRCEWESSTCGQIRRSAQGCQRNWIVRDPEPLSISCEPGRVIFIRRAFYGRRVPSSEVCSYRFPHADNTKCYGRPFRDTFRLQRLCNGQNSCEVEVNNELFGDRCSLTYKYAQATYSCIRQRS